MKLDYLEQERERLDIAMHACTRQIIAIPIGQRSGDNFDLPVSRHAELRAQMLDAGVNILEPDWQIIQ